MISVSRLIIILIITGIAISTSHADEKKATVKVKPTSNVTAKINQGLVVTAPNFSMTMTEIDKLGGEKLFLVAQDLYKQRANVIYKNLGEHILKLEADSLKTTVDDLVAKEITAKAQKITDEDVNKFIEHNGGNDKKNPQAKTQARSYLNLMSLHQSRNKYLSVLFQKYKVNVDLKAPTIPPAAPIERVSLQTEGINTRGEDNALIHIVEFSDFQCGYCKKATKLLSDVEKQFPGKIKVTHRHFPLPNNTESFMAAEASQCAQEQGKFWPYHDQVFKQQRQLGRTDLTSIALKVGLKQEQFDKCLDDGKYKQLVKNDIQEARNHNINATPAFIINGRKVMGAIPLKQMNIILTQELALKKNAKLSNDE